MFDLFKDIEKYKGTPPYASELYGVYQPLLGWQSDLTKKWIQRNGQKFDPRIKRVLDANLKPGPDHIEYQAAGAGGGFTFPELYKATPLVPAEFRREFKVILARDLNSQFLVAARNIVEQFVNAHDGSLPSDSEWATVFSSEAIENLLGKANRAHDDGGGDTQINLDKRDRVLAAMKYESQIAGMIAAYANRQDGLAPDRLSSLFHILPHPSLRDILRSSDPLADIDPKSTSGALSPVGFIHIFRQYFFDLGTFMGEPVEHIWLSPGTTIELVETSTRKNIVERTLETTIESTKRSERNETDKEELSDAVKEENQDSTKFGVSQSNTVNLYVYQGTVSANYGIESTRKDSRETTHKQGREQGEKLSSEIKQSFKSVFRTVTETTDIRSRRHVIQNTSDKLINYELKRKMRRVGVQVQDIGTRLCWQVFINDPGLPLGLSELVHFAESPELNNLKEPDKIPPPSNISKKVVVPLQFRPILNYSNNRAQYEYEGIGGENVGKRILGHIVADNDDDDSQIVFEFKGYKFDSPQTGYDLTKDIRLLSVQGNKMAEIREIRTDPLNGTFDIVMQRLNFGGENVINLEMELIFKPGSDEFTRITEANKKAQEKYDAEKNRLLRKSFMEDVRQRIKDASNIKPRPSWDLREEERTVVYRKLIERLMLDSWETPDTEQNRRLSHVRAEIIRAIFDVDAMLYFVAPEWWMPRRHRAQLNLNLKQEDTPVSLTEDDTVKWGNEKRPDNYKITEDSRPAKLGSSLGWLLQLDGDNLRNAFLNAPWVKAVIPIRPGREKAALNWLKTIEGHENDGWETPYLGNDDPEFQGKNIGEVLEIIADRLQVRNGDIQNVLEADKVFENGFDHLANGFDAGLSANQVFSQWISILPTDQIVAVEYEPKDLLV